ncbi:programmed cell death protein 7 [Mustelus asterias]
MERPPPFYRHGPPAAAFTPHGQGRHPFYQPANRSEEAAGAAFPLPRQHGFPVPERGLAPDRAAAGGDWGPPAESFPPTGPGGPAPASGRVDALEEHSQQWDQGQREHPAAQEHPAAKHLQCAPQPWGREHPPHPQGQHRDHPQGQQHSPHLQGQQHPNYPPHPLGKQHPDHPPYPQGQQHRDHSPHLQGQQHPDHPSQPQGQQHLSHLRQPQGQQQPSQPPHSQGHPHLNHLSLSQGHERPPHPWNHHHQGCPPLPQGHEQKEQLPQVPGYECRDQASFPQGFSHQDRSTDQYREHYPQQGQSYHRPHPPYQQEQMDPQHRYPFHEHLHPEQHPPFSERAGIANSVAPPNHNTPSQHQNNPCQDQNLLRTGNLPAGYGSQNSQLINHSIHNNQQNFPNSLGEIPSWKNEHNVQYNNEKVAAPWPSVANFSQNLKNASGEQLHRNDLMTRKSSPDQFSHNFKYTESLKAQDELWLTRFLSKRRLQPSEVTKPKSSPLVSEVKESVLSACKLVTELTALCQKLRHNVENEAVWTESYLKAVEIKTALQEKLKMLNDSDYLSAVKKKLERIKKKRSSIQRKKQEWRLEKQEEEARAAEREAKIDAWRMKCVRKVEEKKRERELKAAADSVLAEVRKKQADAKRLTDILRALEKLRKLRKEAAARKGVQPPPSADEIFERHIERLRKLIKKRSELYDAEERALRVMLEGEQEEERKRENEKKLKKEREKLEKQQRQVESMMFGDPELPSDHPLQPFRQYYLQAEHSSHVLMQIRQEWDRYLVPEDHPDGSSIPQGWVFPHPPSTDTWATALQQNES